MVILRLVTDEDVNLLYKWASDNEVRVNSFSSSQITYEEHLEWIKGILNSSNNKIYILEVDGIAVGQIRIEYEGEIGIIGYSVQKEYRKKGYGTKMLLLMEELVKEELKIKTLVGRVKYMNLSSQHRFEGLGYGNVAYPEYIEYKKNLYM